MYDGTEGVGGAGASAGEVSRTRSGLVLQRVQPAWAARARRGREVGGAAPAGAWLTAVDLHGGSVYACQYQNNGVLRFHGHTLQYQRIAATHNCLARPL